MTRTLSLDRFLPYRLSLASNAVSGAIAQAYDRLFGLSIPEWRVIAVLAERERTSQLDVVRATRMDKMGVSRAVATLVTRGLVARAPNDRDGRSRLLSLTGEGRTLYTAIAPEALRLEAEVLADFSAEEIARLEADLLRLEAAAARLSPREGA